MRSQPAGSAYVFRFNGSDWVQEQKLLVSDAEEDDFVGRSLAISGDTAVIRAIHDDDNGTDSGSAYLFDATSAFACPWDLDGSAVVGASNLLAN